MAFIRQLHTSLCVLNAEKNVQLHLAAYLRYGRPLQNEQRS